MPIVLQSAPNANTTTVDDILDCTSQDVREVLNPFTGATQVVDQALLIDYTDRISLQMLRFNNWKFLQSNPQLLVTLPGVTDYWVGPVGTGTVGTADTGLGLSDIQSVKKDMVYNRSAYKSLAQTADPPISQQLQLAQKPLFWRNDNSTPYVLNIYPPPDTNSQQPNIVPGGPVVQFVPGGALPQRTYFVVTTFVDSTGGESQASIEAMVVVPANFLVVVKSPVLEIAGASGILSVTTSSGVEINSWNAYLSATSGTETLQAGPLVIGTDFTEPTSGLTTSGIVLGSINQTIAQLGGYVVEFRYYKVRQKLSMLGQILQIPDAYRDIVCAGVNWLAYKYLKKEDEAQVWQGVYQRGLTEMIKDANQGPRDGEFIHPDPRTVVRSINSGVGLDSGMETSIP